MLFVLHTYTVLYICCLETSSSGVKVTDLNQTGPMIEDNNDAVFCGLCSFACLGILQACKFLGLWSAILAKAQAHDSQAALFFL